MIDTAINQLLIYGLNKGLLKEEDMIYSRNLILDILKLDSYTENDVDAELELEDILKLLLDYACENGLCEDDIVSRDLFDTRLMNTLLARPSEIIREFDSLYKESPEKATDFYYNFSKNSDYIRTYRVIKDMKWTTATEYGDIDITINLSKPEKDPKAIAAAKLAKQTSYPKCLLCKENMGYAGRINHPARQNHRIIPLKINNSEWFLQYSPYVYYNEHCIVFCGEHKPMKIERATFEKLFDFVELFPHYMLGSNADLPIVGGSILSHDHFQGGRYEFAMAKAGIEIDFNLEKFKDVECGIVKWPMSVIRLRAKEKKSIVETAAFILDKWIGYSDKEAHIHAYTGETRHNTITPIARMKDGKYEIDLVLRNNITTEDRPDGLYHPRQSLHHIKKENIGLIEVMGLAVLPSRLKAELSLLSEYILLNKDISLCEDIKKHSDWADMIKEKYSDINKENIEDILKYEVGQVFKQVLEDAGVYKFNEEGRKAFIRFLEYCNK